MSGSTRQKTALKATKSASKKSAKAAPKKASEPNRGGRPHSLLADDSTLKTIENLGKIQCTTKEAAAVLKVAESTFLLFLDREPSAREAYEDGKENGKASLRRMQLRAAEGGNVTMMIWLGKQLLGQRDRVEHGGDPNAPIKHDHGISWMTQEQAKARGWA
jgi:hypothetical protein